MSWASRAIEDLRAGRQAVIYPRGKSMMGRVEDGARVVLAPAGERLAIDDVVLVRVKKNVYLHLVKAVQGERYLIGNNRGGTNGWVGRTAIYGIAVQIDNGG